MGSCFSYTSRETDGVQPFPWEQPRRAARSKPKGGKIISYDSHSPKSGLLSQERCSSMILMLLSVVLAIGAVAEQPQSSNSKPQSYSSNSADEALPQKSVKPEDPVINVQGICKDNSAKAGASRLCKTIVTREQFERLIAALTAAGQPIPPNGRQKLAQAYVDLLAYEEAARASGTESSPEFRDLMDWIRLRTLSEMHRRSLQERYRTPSAQDIDDYYHQNLSNFTDIKLRRILIPRKNPSARNQEEYEKHALQVANDLRERAAKGEDPDQLQKEVYTNLGLTSPPPTDVGNRRKATLLAQERDEVFAMSVGGVSQVEQEPYSFVIYKVDSKYLLPEEVVKDEISREISKQRLDSALKAITSQAHPEFNQQYFTPAPSLPANSPPAASPAGQQPADRRPQ